MPNDPGMPYGGGSYYDQSLPQAPMPDPIFSNNNYAQNNANIMYSGQTQFQATMQVAQSNMQQHMQDVLQGTMASAMAIYNVGKSAHEKAREVIYQDRLVSDGVYALERTAWRDVTWGSGLAGSALGRELKIGGRRPEFMTGGEYAFQMNRSFQHRLGEWKDEAVAGAASMGASWLGMQVSGPAGFVAGYAFDQTIGKILQPTMERHAAVREMKTFTEMADLNQGTGQRRMSASASDDMANRFFDHDVSALKYVPVFGDIMAGKVGPEIKYKDTFKKMAQFDLLRDLNPDDVDKITDRVKKTAVIMDKFAGLMNTTRDTILEIKGKFGSVGMGDSQQNAALGNLANFTTGTGLSVNTALAYHGQFTEMGKQGNYFRTGNENLQGGFGLAEIASIKSLQNSGLISKSYDAGTLGMQFYANAVGQNQTPLGRVLEHGGIEQTRDFYTKQGNGEAYLGIQVERLDMFGKKENPLDTYKTNQDELVKRLRASGMSEQKIFSYLLGRETTKEGAEQAFEIYSGISGIGVSAKDLSIVNRRLERTGQKVSSFKFSEFGSLKGLDSNNFGTTNDNLLEHQGRAKNAYQAALLSNEINKESGDLYYGNKKALSDNDVSARLGQYYQNTAQGVDTSEELKALVKLLRDKKYAKDDSEGKQIVDQSVVHLEESKKIFKSTLSLSSGGLAGFIEDYKKNRVQLTDKEMIEYNKIRSKNSFLSVNDMNRIKGELDNAKTEEDKKRVLDKYGFTMHSTSGQGTTGTIGEYNFNESMMSFNDLFKGKHGITDENMDLVSRVNEHYKSMLGDKDKKKLLEGYGITSGKDYYSKFGSAAGHLSSLVSGKSSEKDLGQLGKELALLTSTDINTGEKLANFLANHQAQAGEFLTHLQNQDFGFIQQAAKSVASTGEMTGDANAKAIEDFTKVLTLLTDALTKKH